MKKCVKRKFFQKRVNLQSEKLLKSLNGYYKNMKKLFVSHFQVASVVHIRLFVRLHKWLMRSELAFLILKQAVPNRHGMFMRQYVYVRKEKIQMRL